MRHIPSLPSVLQPQHEHYQALIAVNCKLKINSSVRACHTLAPGCPYAEQQAAVWSQGCDGGG
jgi:hypothetical protein